MFESRFDWLPTESAAEWGSFDGEMMQTGLRHLDYRQVIASNCAQLVEQVPDPVPIRAYFFGASRKRYLSDFSP